MYACWADARRAPLSGSNGNFTLLGPFPSYRDLIPFPVNPRSKITNSPSLPLPPLLRAAASTVLALASPSHLTTFPLLLPHSPRLSPDRITLSSDLSSKRHGEERPPLQATR